MTQPLTLTDRADIFHLELRGPRVVSTRTGNMITKPNTPLAICQAIAARHHEWIVEEHPVERLTIDRPDRPRESRTYDLTQHSALVRRAVHALLARDWPTRQTTPDGWHGVSTVK